VAARLRKDESAAVVLTMDAGPSSPDATAPIIRLRRDANAAANDASIYRYDRPGLLAALAHSAGAR
jgi:two-component system chemotaxis sensor kinase CheA